MRFHALRTAREHAVANRAVAAVFRAAGARRAKVRFQEGVLPTLFLPGEDIWLAYHALENRYRNAFGVGDPVGRRNLWPSVQLNLPLAPGSSTPHARYLRDARGDLWVAHTGTLGGRQAGISREGFVRALGGTRTVTIDGAPAELVVLGTFAKPAALLAEIARLAHTAAAYRGALSAGLV